MLFPRSGCCFPLNINFWMHRYFMHVHILHKARVLQVQMQTLANAIRHSARIRVHAWTMKRHALAPISLYLNKFSFQRILFCVWPKRRVSADKKSFESIQMWLNLQTARTCSQWVRDVSAPKWGSNGRTSHSPEQILYPSSLDVIWISNRVGHMRWVNLHMWSIERIGRREDGRPQNYVQFLQQIVWERTNVWHASNQPLPIANLFTCITFLHRPMLLLWIGAYREYEISHIIHFFDGSSDAATAPF